MNAMIIGNSTSERRVANPLTVALLEPNARLRMELTNREKWPAYQQAIGDMLQNTHTPAAPWHLVSAQDKKYARIEVLRRLITTLEQL